jgi:hypothetical protein
MVSRENPDPADKLGSRKDLFFPLILGGDWILYMLSKCSTSEVHSQLWVLNNAFWDLLSLYLSEEQVC